MEGSWRRNAIAAVKLFVGDKVRKGIGTWPTKEVENLTIFFVATVHSS
jgi:hypothetical protein